MDKFYVMAGMPFMLLVFLLIAWPFKRLVQRMKDSRLKRLLLTRW